MDEINQDSKKWGDMSEVPVKVMEPEFIANLTTPTLHLLIVPQLSLQCLRALSIGKGWAGWVIRCHMTTSVKMWDLTWGPPKPRWSMNEYEEVHEMPKIVPNIACLGFMCLFLLGEAPWIISTTWTLGRKQGEGTSAVHSMIHFTLWWFTLSLKILRPP